MKTLFIHRRDLRIEDNTGLNAAITGADQKSHAVLSCFILDPQQVSEQNEFRSMKQLCFMRESLRELEDAYTAKGGRLHLFSGNPAEVVAALLHTADIGAVYVNADYSPYATKRDEAIAAVCLRAGVPFIKTHDTLLMGDPASVMKTDGKPYTVFTPFWKRAAEAPVARPVPNAASMQTRFVTSVITGQGIAYADLSLLASDEDVSDLAVAPGRVVALAILARASSFSDYAATRDILIQPTTRLSAHHKFGTISIRETYYAFGAALGFSHGFIRQLYWRDFYTYLAFHMPRVIGESYDKKHEILFSEIDTEAIERWKIGMTGFPIVDAGMRELRATGYMHNRARLICGSFLTKDLHQPWWIGEKHFAQHLIDYDVSVNNGNWQWVGGTGTDPVPYFRIFNPWLQAKKFDPDALYIKKWVPELAGYSAKVIHAIPTTPLQPSLESGCYPEPMVDHSVEMKRIRELYAP